MEQISLFDRPTLNIDTSFKKACAAAAAKCGLSRDQIVDAMNALAADYGIHLVKGGGKLTLPAFEKWLNGNDCERPMPLKAVAVFCAVVKSPEPIRAIAAPLGLMVAGAEDQQLLKWAKANLRAREARREMKRIEDDLEI